LPCGSIATLPTAAPAAPVGYWAPTPSPRLSPPPPRLSQCAITTPRPPPWTCFPTPTSCPPPPPWILTGSTSARTAW